MRNEAVGNDERVGSGCRKRTVVDVWADRRLCRTRDTTLASNTAELYVEAAVGSDRRRLRDVVVDYTEFRGS